MPHAYKVRKFSVQLRLPPEYSLTKFANGTLVLAFDTPAEVDALGKLAEQKDGFVFGIVDPRDTNTLACLVVHRSTTRNTHTILTTVEGSFLSPNAQGFLQDIYKGKNVLLEITHLSGEQRCSRYITAYSSKGTKSEYRQLLNLYQAGGKKN